MSLAWPLLQRFTLDTALLEAIPSISDGSMAAAAPLAPLAAEELLAAFPLTQLFELLREATVEADVAHVCLIDIAMRYFCLLDA